MAAAPLPKATPNSLRPMRRYGASPYAAPVPSPCRRAGLQYNPCRISALPCPGISFPHDDSNALPIGQNPSHGGAPWRQQVSCRLPWPPALQPASWPRWRSLRPRPAVPGSAIARLPRLQQGLALPGPRSRTPSDTRRISD